MSKISRHSKFYFIYILLVKEYKCHQNVLKVNKVKVYCAEYFNMY